MSVPALLTKMSIWPKRSMASATIPRICSSRVTSTCTPSALRPSPSIAATTGAIRSLTISATTTLAPQRAILRAIARPMPCPAPVTTATLSVSCAIAGTSRRCRRHIPQRRGDFVAATPDVIDRPHALGLEYGLSHQGLAILAQVAEVEDYVGQVPAVVEIVKTLEARIMDGIVFEDRLAG